MKNKLMLMVFLGSFSFFTCAKEQATVAEQKRADKRHERSVAIQNNKQEKAKETQGKPEKNSQRNRAVEKKAAKPSKVKVQKAPKKHVTGKKIESQDEELYQEKKEHFAGKKAVQDLPAQVKKATPISPDAIVENQIVAIIYATPQSDPGSEKTFEKVSDIIITQFDVDRASIDGRQRSLDELIFELLMYFEARFFYKMIMPDDAVDKYINSLKEQNSISDEKLQEMFTLAGYTYDEAREQLRMMQSIDSLLNFKIRSRLVAPDKDVKEYYEANPVYEEASYKIKKAFIPEGVVAADNLKVMSDATLDNPLIEWSTAYWLADDEITDARREILQGMEVDGYSVPEKVEGGYEVIKLLVSKPRALKTLESRYREIAMTLQVPQYEKMFAEFKKELFDKYEIVYL